MKSGDLTTLATAKVWLNIPGAGNEDSGAADPILNRLITAASAIVLDHLNREDLGLRTVTERYDTFGGDRLILKQWPVHRIVSVRIREQSIDDAGQGSASGYRLQDTASANGGQQKLAFVNMRLPNEQQGVEVVYEAGYVRDEDRELPEAAENATTVSVTAYSAMIAEHGVTDADGVALTRIRTGAPAAGEYKVTESGVYTFDASRAGETMTLRYSYVPAVLEDTVIQMVGQKFKAKDNIGVSSKNLAGQESIVFDKRDFTPSMREALASFRRIA
jgi:hypothetical protein